MIQEYGKEKKRKHSSRTLSVVKRGSGQHFGSFSIFPGGLPELSMPQSASKKLLDWRYTTGRHVQVCGGHGCFYSSVPSIPSLLWLEILVQALFGQHSQITEENIWGRESLALLCRHTPPFVSLGRTNLSLVSGCLPNLFSVSLTLLKHFKQHLLFPISLVEHEMTHCSWELYCFPEQPALEWVLYQCVPLAHQSGFTHLSPHVSSATDEHFNQWLKLN